MCPILDYWSQRRWRLGENEGGMQVYILKVKCPLIDINVCIEKELFSVWGGTTAAHLQVILSRYFVFVLSQGSRN